ncbi:Hypothetical protein SMAX5B_000825, partial [Scophthalmus maximus]
MVLVLKPRCDKTKPPRTASSLSPNQTRPENWDLGDHSRTCTGPGADAGGP